MSLATCACGVEQGGEKRKWDEDILISYSQSPWAVMLLVDESFLACGNPMGRGRALAMQD